MGKTRREGERKRTFAAGADKPERHHASRRLYPSSGELNVTRWDETGWGGRKNRREIKALAGNSATCLGFCFRLVAGSIPAASRGGTGAYRASWPSLPNPQAFMRSKSEVRESPSRLAALPL